MLSRHLLIDAVLAVGPALAAVAGSPSCSVGSLKCPSDLPLSCQNKTQVENTCCFNYPGGQVLLTQFWDTAPSTGPADSWTVHGLWPDNCDGSYEQYCDKNREYFNITTMLTTGAPQTLEYMKVYWKDYQGDDEDFWEHEFNKHGTCMSSLEPRCYPDYSPGAEVVDYFKQAVKMFKTLPSYNWLAEAGIEPSSSKTYKLSDISAALKKHHGQDVIINCNKNKELNELWYHYNIQGSVQRGKYVAVPPVGSPSTCPATGIKYLPKYASGTPTSTKSTSAGPAPTAAPGQLSGKGKFYIESDSQGFLIGAGKWYRSGNSPAGYTAVPNADGETFMLSTGKGDCAIQKDTSLLCGSSVDSPSDFGYDGTYLTYDGANTFYAEAVPSGIEQGTVYTSSKAVSFKITWTAI